MLLKYRSILEKFLEIKGWKEVLCYNRKRSYSRNLKVIPDERAVPFYQDRGNTLSRDRTHSVLEIK